MIWLFVCFFLYLFALIHTIAASFQFVSSCSTALLRWKEFRLFFLNVAYGSVNFPIVFIALGLIRFYLRCFLCLMFHFWHCKALRSYRRVLNNSTIMLLLCYYHNYYFLDFLSSDYKVLVTNLTCSKSSGKQNQSIYSWTYLCGYIVTLPAPAGQGLILHRVLLLLLNLPAPAGQVLILHRVLLLLLLRLLLLLLLLLSVNMSISHTCYVRFWPNLA